MGGEGRSSNADRPIRILLADDHPVIRTGLIAVLAQEADLELVAEADNGGVRGGRCVQAPDPSPR
jgi:DNA-binding NarL/FixJ family response regulator